MAPGETRAIGATFRRAACCPARPYARTRHDRSARGRAAIPTALLARSQSDRAGDLQNQGALRKTAARTFDGLCENIGRFIDSFTPTECRNFLSNSGYA